MLQQSNDFAIYFCVYICVFSWLLWLTCKVYIFCIYDGLQLFHFLHSFPEEMYSIHRSKYLTLRVKLRKLIEIKIGINLSLGQFSSYFLTLQLAQEQLKIDVEKTIGSLFSMFCNKMHLSI